MKTVVRVQSPRVVVVHVLAESATLIVRCTFGTGQVMVS